VPRPKGSKNKAKKQPDKITGWRENGKIYILLEYEEKKEKGKKMKSRVILFSVTMAAIMALIFSPGPAQAASRTLTLEWGQAAESTGKADFDGWRLYWGTSSRTYIESTVIPFTGASSTYQTSKVITVQDKAETTIYFAVTARDKNGNESDYSNEVSYTFDFLPPEGPFNLVIKIVTNP
jgi:hypothetical protein